MVDNRLINILIYSSKVKEEVIVEHGDEHGYYDMIAVNIVSNILQVDKILKKEKEKMDTINVTVNEVAEEIKIIIV